MKALPLCIYLLFSCSVMSNSLCVQHTRLPCPSLSPEICSYLCPLSRWCHPTISSSVTSLSSYLQSLPESGSFPMSWHFASSGQSTGASASASDLLLGRQLGMSNRGWSGWKGCKLISKLNHRHIQESSQICYKNNSKTFSTPALVC